MIHLTLLSLQKFMDCGIEAEKGARDYEECIAAVSIMLLVLIDVPFMQQQTDTAQGSSKLILLKATLING